MKVSKKAIFVTLGGCVALTMGGWIVWPTPNYSDQGVMQQTPGASGDYVTLFQSPRSENVPKTHNEILQLAEQVDAAPKAEVFAELDKMVATEKSHYQVIFYDYRDAISDLENLSADFDNLVREGAAAQVRAKLNKELQIKAQEVIRLGREANDAYIVLMAKYDESVPVILDKHF